MNSLNNNDAGTRIFENLETLTENELLELSAQMDTLPKPHVEGALDTFKRSYLPEASEVSLYDFEREVKRVKRINIRTLLVAAVVAAMMIASSMVSYAAGAASGGKKDTDSKISEAEKSTEKEELRTTVEIDGHTKELYVIKLLDEFDRTEYTPSKSVDDQILLKMSGSLYDMNYHYADLDGSVLEFEEIPLDELRDGMMEKATEMYGAKFIDFTKEDPFTVTELSEISYSREEAGDYYFEFFKGSNYVIESFDPFLKVHKKIFANYDTNFAMETTMSIYVKCYNAEKDVYQEFVVSKTDIGCFEVAFDAPEGWIPTEAYIVVENPLIGKSRHGLSAFSNEEESPSEFREKLDAALEKLQKEKEEKNDIINKIESMQDK